MLSQSSRKKTRDQFQTTKKLTKKQYVINVIQPKKAKKLTFIIFYVFDRVYDHENVNVFIIDQLIY